ncbi:MAG: hypothetical protein RLZ98_837 [Pseudomonadota bacterium]|jgi:uncharacterized membrane protein YedE/YeeE
MALIWASLVSGLLFGAGLTISQMINPAKVIGFLDFAGNWDPTLAVVMGAALAVSAIGFRFVKQLANPLAAHNFQLPTRRDIDFNLIAGAVLFGVGWGLAGYCPGPAIAGLAMGMWQIAAFVAAMIGGMLAAKVLLR